jgi:hypothetical protein
VKACLAVLVVMLRASAAAAQTLDVPQYALAVEALSAALAAGDTGSAARLAEELQAKEVDFEGERIRPDPHLLAAVRSATPAQASLLARRARAVVEALRAASPGARPEKPDRVLLERLRAEHQATRGGTVDTPQVRPLPERLADALVDAGAWLLEKLGRLWDWLRALWPKPRRDLPKEGGAVGVTLATTAAALTVLLLLAWRRGRSPAPSPSSGSGLPDAPGADEDPLSRESGEWERYARQLATGGRYREAIRAWYHAVLVSLFRRGHLEPRKGRTNWEHVSRVPAAMPWRPPLVEMTRCFDREWYGRDASSAEAHRECADIARAILRAVDQGERA